MDIDMSKEARAAIAQAFKKSELENQETREFKIIPPPETKPKSTLAEWLKELFDFAFTKRESTAAMRNFLKTHRCTGVENGVPRWRRLPSFYERGRKSYHPSEGRVPGSLRRSR